MLFFIIELDAGRIKKDGILNIDIAYENIEEHFVKKDVTLYQKIGHIRIYTRDIDKHDFEYLWMVNSALKSLYGLDIMSSSGDLWMLMTRQDMYAQRRIY